MAQGALGSPRLLPRATGGAMASRNGSVLYYGNNLDILRRYVKDDSVDLVYLDPPFKSNQDYNVLFAEKTGTKSAAQITAFEDTWHWDQVAALAYAEIVEAGGKASQAMQAFRTFLAESDMMAYLAMMAPRLVELRRVLKPTGSIYLHCDPTASHYLKVLMDGIFGPGHFRNEIIWKRTTAHSSAKRFAPVHDVILYYARDENPIWNAPRTAYDGAYLDKYYRFDDGDGKLYWRADITGAGVRGGETGQSWRGRDVTAAQPSALRRTHAATSDGPPPVRAHSSQAPPQCPVHPAFAHRHDAATALIA